jgi:hypothetical protein
VRALHSAAAIAGATSGPWVQPSGDGFQARDQAPSSPSRTHRAQPAQFASRGRVHPPAPPDIVRRLPLMRPGFPIKTRQLCTAHRYHGLALYVAARSYNDPP